jgi:hypothetical protein
MEWALVGSCSLVRFVAKAFYEAARKLWNHSRTIMGGSRLARWRNVPRQIDFDSEAADSPPPA